LDYFLGNEVGSDEYRDTQPGNGLNIAAGFNFSGMTEINGEGGLKEADLDMLKAIRNWIDAIISGTEDTDPNKSWAAYAGCDELEPVLTLAFNSMWDLGINPAPHYWEQPEDILAAYNEDVRIFGKKS
jgi:hypothetical protein